MTLQRLVVKSGLEMREDTLGARVREAKASEAGAA
jgi:hypothetical protein